MELSNKPILDAYRCVGEVLGSHFFLQKAPVTSIIASSSTSYKIYDSQLKIQNISPVFPDHISGIFSDSNKMLIRCGTKLLKMSYSHIIKDWEIGEEVEKSSILVFGELILLAEDKKLIVIDGDNIQTIDVGFIIKGIHHPITYINKVIIHGDNNLQLWNIVTKYKVYDFSHLFTENIITICTSPKVDVIAISIENKVLMFNLKTAKVLFELVQKQRAQSLCFSDSGIPIIATGDKQGNLRIWSLNSKQIIGLINAHQGSIDYLEFLPGELLLVSGCIADNSIKQWKYDETEAAHFRKLRERCGLKNNIQNFKIQSNTQITVNSQDQTLYLSLISDNNCYILPQCLDSVLPTHISSHGTKLNVYKNQTKTKTIDAGIEIIGGKISQSQNYYVVYSDKKLIRLGGGDTITWEFEAKIRQVVINQPYHIFTIVEGGELYCLPFAGPGSSNPQQFEAVYGIQNLVLSLDKSYLAYGSSTVKIINSKTLAPVRELQLRTTGSRLSFSHDNRFLFSSSSGLFQIWDILHGNLYKQFDLQQSMLCHQMTPDGSYVISVFEGRRELSIWNNFLGVVATSDTKDVLKFQTDIIKLPPDLRQYINNVVIEHNYNNNAYEDIQNMLQDIPNVNSTLQLTEQPLSQWLPLIYYDEIKERNRPISTAQKKIQTPFFLDSENKTKFINKMDQEHKQKLEAQSRILDQKQYKLMQQNSKKIVFSETDDAAVRQQEYRSLMKTLKSLSIAEIDYQLRTLVFLPQNIPRLMQFFQFILKDKHDYDLKIAYYYRFLSIFGTSIIQNQEVQLKINGWDKISNLYKYTSEVVERLTLKS